jgi:hypothetical protein
MYSTKTTWKYPPAYHDGKANFDHTPILNRKVFIIILAIPIFGGVDDPHPNEMMLDMELKEVNDGIKVQ